MDNAQWLELFQPFTAIKNLYVFKISVVHCDEPTNSQRERVTEMLPALESLDLEEFWPSGSV
jgi:hypothetical protein